MNTPPGGCFSCAEPPCPQDRNVVAWQLGRPVEGEFKILQRCAHGYPVGILNHPLPRGWPGPVFSNPWWLTCPRWQRDVYSLESRTFLKKWEYLLTESDQNLFRRKAISLRLHLLGARYRALLQEEQPGLMKELRERGIAGEEGQGLKCLHAHFAFYLLVPTYSLGMTIQEMYAEPVEERCGGYCRGREDHAPGSY